MYRVGSLRQEHGRGFTIVELLIVVVVIAILAAITIVAYRGIQERAVESSLQQTISQAVKKLEVVKQGSSSGVYPASKAEIGIITPTGMTLDYFYNASGDTYCVQVLQSGKWYSARSTNKQIIKAACSESGLIGWWKLNGNADDASGNALNGTVSGATIATGQGGVPATAYGFDGTDDSISLGSSSLLNPTASGFTASVWFNKAGSLSSERTIIRKDLQYQIATINATNIRNLMGTSGGTNGWVATNDFAYTLTTGTWYHFVTVWDGSTLKSYINGALVSTATVTGSPINTANPLTISSAGRHIQGSVDDLRLYSRALTADDIAALYAAGAE